MTTQQDTPLPGTPHHDTARPAAPHQEGPGAGTVVVVADDDEDIRSLVGLKLTQAGYAVQCHGDGLAALEAIRAQVPPLAVLDVMMPGLSGIDVLREVRREEALQGVKIILLTARSRDSDVDDGFSTGADDYIIKPFSPRELVHRVGAVLGRHR